MSPHVGACFEKDEKKSEKTSFEEDFGDFIDEGVKKDREAELNLSKSGKKLGRNDPCPCGSGKKYKKCCVDKDNAVTEVPESSIARIEDKYDLLEMYPTDSEFSIKHTKKKQSRSTSLCIRHCTTEQYRYGSREICTGSRPVGLII